MITSIFRFGTVIISSNSRIKHSSGSFTDTPASTRSRMGFSSITQNITSARSVMTCIRSGTSNTWWIICRLLPTSRDIITFSAASTRFTRSRSCRYFIVGSTRVAHARSRNPSSPSFARAGLHSGGQS